MNLHYFLRLNCHLTLCGVQEFETSSAVYARKNCLAHLMSCQENYPRKRRREEHDRRGYVDPETPSGEVPFS